MKRTPTVTSDTPNLEEISHRLHHLLGLRAALAPFQVSLETLGEQVLAPEERRQLLALWRPCQEQIDRLLETAPGDRSWVARIRLLRQEVEGNLLDELYSPTALADLAEAFDQTCEILLLGLDRNLQGALTPPIQEADQPHGRGR
jgi:hypothetical protein